MEWFKEMSNLLGVEGAIDVAQIHIQKPKVPSICD
jgi:hypothetical protein